jgi:hypothetical protein
VDRIDGGGANSVHRTYSATGTQQAVRRILAGCDPNGDLDRRSGNHNSGGRNGIWRILSDTEAVRRIHCDGGGSWVAYPDTELTSVISAPQVGQFRGRLLEAPKMVLSRGKEDDDE